MISVSRREMMMGAAVVALGAALRPATLRAAPPQVRNVTTGGVYDNLSAAIAEAAPGEELMISGRHTGQFTLPKPLSLRGDGSAVIDAGGSGTAVVISGDDVTLDRLTITGSGQSNTYRTVWGDAGLLVTGARARLSALDVNGNADGIVLLGGGGTVLSRSRVADNTGDGIKIFGGVGHRIETCEIGGNRAGVMVDALYDEGRLRETIIPTMEDMAAQERLSRVKDTAEPAHDHVIAANKLPGNETFGIYICWKSHDIEVSDNEVWETGVTRPISRDAEQFWEGMLGALLGTHVDLKPDMLGTGLMITCLPHDNLVTGNLSRDNLAFGLGLTETTANTARDNRFVGNRVGVNVAHSDDNSFIANTVTGNVQYGILVDVLMSDTPSSDAATGNLFSRNSLAANGINAYDSSDTRLSVADFDKFLDELPLPDVLRQQMKANPPMRRMMAEQMAARHKPGLNRWDDGTLGNHYDDFDAPAEGFRDDDGDGVSEVAHPIPGGGHVDRFPLSQARALDG